MKLIGLDVGEKRIGVAKASSDTRIAVPVGFVEVSEDGAEWEELKRISRVQGTTWFVVGLPRSNEGNETKQSLYARRFAKTLTEKIPGARVRFQDESLTSVVAEERLRARKKKYEKGEIDAEAASIILQDFLENFSENSSDFVAEAPKKVAVNAKKVQAGAKNLGESVKNAPKNLAKTGEKAGKTLRKRVKNGKKGRKSVIFAVLAVVLIGVIAGVTGVVLKIREIRAAERAAYYAELEAADKAEEFSFTILPGETIFTIQENLRNVKRTEEITGYSEGEIAAAFKKDYDFWFLEGRPEGASLEGYLYGETHNFFVDATVEEILEKFLAGTGAVIEENNLVERYAARGLSLYEGITLASIVQKEAKAAEMPTVAQVFLTRLDYGMALGSDVTVTYALDVIDPERVFYAYNEDALRVNSCYNTRLYRGLPCGPISNPGMAALLAVAEPSETGYLYFLTGDDGMMYYSYTEAEHNNNAWLHCQELCNVSL